MVVHLVVTPRNGVAVAVAVIVAGEIVSQADLADMYAAFRSFDHAEMS
ncbi:MAG: hypothetical protein ACI8Y4_003031 [Candidatus Poriferisodalaceae bacterium]|jgi:hypothetical protein